MKLMGRHPELYNLSLGTRDSIVGQAKHCLGCMLANMRLGAHAMYNHFLAKPAEAAGECYHADVAGPIRPLGIGGAKYLLAVIDEYTRYLHVIPMRRKSQAASLLAQLFERVRIQVMRSKHAGILRLHTDKGGEFKSRDLESFCTWRGIVHTFTDTAAHQSNGLVERRIGLLNTGVRSCLLRSGLPHYLWIEAYLHVAHAQNLLPSHALLNRETCLKGKKRKLADVTELEDNVSDFRRCVPCCITEMCQRRPLGF